MSRYASTVPLPRRQQEQEDTTLRGSVADLLDQLYTARQQRDNAYRETASLHRRLEAYRFERDRLAAMLVRVRQQVGRRRSRRAVAEGQLELWD